ncbi:MAG: hypothetical protein K0S18_2125 [Anaerocolumna sp.]|nr:hypothetical protein [Anaerocolumna sp.]
MSIKYTLGRSEFRTFEEGLEKEWLLTNGIGGFASQSIIGANNRIFSGYLIASLHPPVDRMLVLAKTQEAVCIGDKEYDLTAQSYIGGNREGQKYLNRFELDVVPTYTYEVQGIQIKKSIAMEYGKNKVVICYEIRGGRKEASVNITPCFNYRPFGEVTEKSQLKFKKKLFKDIQGGSLILTPENHPDVQIEFSSSEGNYYDRSLKPVSMATPNYLIEENELYPMDVRTGFMGVDQHYFGKTSCLGSRCIYSKKRVHRLKNHYGWISMVYRLGQRYYDRITGTYFVHRKTRRCQRHFRIVLQIYKRWHDS